MQLIHLKEGLRMWKRAQTVRKQGLPKYEGSPVEICESVLYACWDADKKYFRTSAGHFCEFWSRDFGWCAEALVRLGYQDRVIQTLEYALEKFSTHGRIRTTISPDGVPFDFPYYAADSLPFMIRAIREANAQQLVAKYREFLKNEIQYYFQTVFDKERSLVRQDKTFSSIKDLSKRRSSCYSNCMMSMLSDDLTYLGLENPFLNYDLKKSIMGHFWNGRFFYEDFSATSVVTGDANIFPFWCGVTSDRNIFQTAMASVQQAGLTSPFPLRYTSQKPEGMHIYDLLAGDYEHHTSWAHLGMCFLDVTSKFRPDMLGAFMDQYAKVIEKDRNFLEVHDEGGVPFSNFFYCCDDSMLWACKYMYLAKKSGDTDG